MKRAVVPILSLAFGVVSLGAVRHLSPATRAGTGRHVGVAAGMLGSSVDSGLIARTDDPDLAEARRRLHDGEAGTYIGDILRERDSALTRWPDRDGVPLTVWIQPMSPVSDFSAAYIGQVRGAFREWDSLNLPVHFAFVDDSAAADVHVNWIDHFSEPISGRTRWERDDNYLITDANIILAVHHNDGETLDGDAMHAMALHEVGHLLGLDHTRDSLTIMAPKVRVRSLTDEDRATVRLLYSLPAGPLR